MIRHVRERVKRANIVLNQIWGIGERKFKADSKMRMFMFDALVMGVLLYGVELWGFKERVEVERVQLRYIRTTLSR
ncbi:hypothetical protein WN55_03917 [Dufourea novaeangliae]|uniref:Uncharacterized protein n=1 Tax=Dufourea novaeangliae TaxID=178035 RepID=A0A154PK02_DUFNO|nr:hypothetical protein WN55_03917 [Dufourea novaeangliae]